MIQELTAAVQHHQVFSRFRPYTGEFPPNCDADFLGTVVPPEFVRGLVPLGTHAWKVEDFYVRYNEEYFEWIDLLESVVAANGTYTMIDLGAGYGRWSVRAAYAVKQYDSKLQCRLIAVEPEPVVYGWMQKHFSNHGIGLSGHKLIHAAVCEQPGKVHFNIGGPRGGPFDRPPSAWYGQFLTHDYDLVGNTTRDGDYAGCKAYLHKSGWRSIRIPSISLRTLLKKLDRVDLIDLDIEGQELVTLTAAVAGLDAKVKRLHIGTHSAEIEAGLRQLLSDHGWRCLADYPLLKTSQTPWGDISFENGVQSWVNPRL